jgi:hypothetical protein
LGEERGDVDGDGVFGALRIHNIMLEGTSCLLKKTRSILGLQSSHEGFA